MTEDADIQEFISATDICDFQNERKVLCLQKKEKKHLFCLVEKETRGERERSVIQKMEWLLVFDPACWCQKNPVARMFGIYLTYFNIFECYWHCCSLSLFILFCLHIGKPVFVVQGTFEQRKYVRFVCWGKHGFYREK